MGELLGIFLISRQIYFQTKHMIDKIQYSKNYMNIKIELKLNLKNMNKCNIINSKKKKEKEKN